MEEQKGGNNACRTGVLPDPRTVLAMGRRLNLRPVNSKQWEAVREK